METAKLSQKYQIVIPKDVRKRMHLEAGSRLEIYPLDEKRAILAKRSSTSVQGLKGLGKDVWRAEGGAARYIKQERASWIKRSGLTQ